MYHTSYLADFAYQGWNLRLEAMKFCMLEGQHSFLSQTSLQIKVLQQG